MDRIFGRLGTLLLFVGITIALATYWPIIVQEFSYQNHLRKVEEQQKLPPSLRSFPTPIQAEFSIVIPKINANAPVVVNVDATDPKQYQYALTKGVAHAKGSALPGDGGNAFLFSHSSADFFLATRYNSIFYLLGKLIPGDLIYIFRDGRRYTFQVQKISTVKPDQISYLKMGDVGSDPRLTLMTCWPPGTDFFRKIVEANLVEVTHYP